jgi:hypothetical protein
MLSLVGSQMPGTIVRVDARSSAAVQRKGFEAAFTGGDGVF